MVLSLRQKSVNSQTFHCLRTAWINNKATEQIQARPVMKKVLYVTPRSRNTANKYTYASASMCKWDKLVQSNIQNTVKQFLFAIKSSSLSIYTRLPFKKRQFSSQKLISSLIWHAGIPLGTQEWEFFWLRFWTLYYFIVSYVKILRFSKKYFFDWASIEKGTIFPRSPRTTRNEKKFWARSKNIFFIFLFMNPLYELILVFFRNLIH